MMEVCGDCLELNRKLMWCERMKRHVTLDWKACLHFKERNR